MPSRMPRASSSRWSSRPRVDQFSRAATPASSARPAAQSAMMRSWSATEARPASEPKRARSSRRSNGVTCSSRPGSSGFRSHALRRRGTRRRREGGIDVFGAERRSEACVRLAHRIEIPSVSWGTASRTASSCNDAAMRCAASTERVSSGATIVCFARRVCTSPASSSLAIASRIGVRLTPSHSSSSGLRRGACLERARR